MWDVCEIKAEYGPSSGSARASLAVASDFLHSLTAFSEIWGTKAYSTFTFSIRPWCEDASAERKLLWGKYLVFSLLKYQQTKNSACRLMPCSF